LISDDESREIFREEAFDLLAELESTLLELENSPEDLDLVNRAFRALHTIKGSGAMFGFDDIADFTHSVESVFDKIRNEELKVTCPLINLTFAARDHILALLNGVDPADPKGNGTPERGLEIMAQVQALLSGEEAAEAAAGSAVPPDGCEPVAAAPTPSEPVPAEPAAMIAPEAAGPRTWRIRIRARESKLDKELKLDELFASLRELGPCTVRVDHSRLPDLPDLDPRTLYLSWVVDLTTSTAQADIQDLFFFSDIDLDVDVRPSEGLLEETGLDEPLALRGLAAAGQPIFAPAPDAIPAAPAGEAPIALDLLDDKPPKLGEILVQDGVIKPEDLHQALQKQKPLGKILTESGLASEQQVEQAAAKQQQNREASAKQSKEAASSLRVAAEKLDTLVDLVGELVIVQAQISQIVSERGDPLLTALAEQLERLSADLRDSTLGIRMLPIGSAFSKFRRLVRDLSAELGKDIELVTRGEETELDKTVLERLGDPLVHLLRNSIDHGIDMPEERKAAGKRPRGLILLEAEHSGSEVLIRITDDGKGMDPEVIRKKAVEKGLIASDADLSEKETLKLIFQPGFSTAAKVTSISGRGVGMDVVHRAIDALRGAIEIQSVKGQGTTITIRLPLTLAIIEGLQVQVGDGFYVIPLSLVEECVELHRKDVDETGRQRIINLRGELVPYIQLRRWFDLPGESPDIEQIVITGVEGRRVGIVVDNVIGEHQTVIKSLGRVYRDVEGISGATIKGDGSLALILDVPRLVRSVAAAQG
jgi:two-component system chemotaxis sensor kinase CheA